MTAPFINILNEMTNEDIHWDANFFSLHPEIVNSNLLELINMSEPKIDQLLLHALVEENRYVVAHVLLTMRLCLTFPADIMSWNGLQVQIYADNTVSFSGNDLNHLRDFWVNWIRK